jgi:hypothetical protein
LSENDEDDLFEAPKMLLRFQDISVLPDKDKEHILYTIDGLIKSEKLQTQ